MKRKDMEPINCSICFDEITPEHLVEYKKNSSNDWFTLSTCFECIILMKQSQFKTYVDGVKKSDCKKELKRLLGNKTQFTESFTNT